MAALISKVCTGLLIAQRVLEADFFKESRRVGVYIHCGPLREVDTTQLVSAVTHAGVMHGGGLSCRASIPHFLAIESTEAAFLWEDYIVPRRGQAVLHSSSAGQGLKYAADPLRYVSNAPSFDTSLYRVAIGQELAYAWRSTPSLLA